MMFSGNYNHVFRTLFISNLQNEPSIGLIVFYNKLIFLLQIPGFITLADFFNYQMITSNDNLSINYSTKFPNTYYPTINFTNHIL